MDAVSAGAFIWKRSSHGRAHRCLPHSRGQGLLLDAAVWVPRQSAAGSKSAETKSAKGAKAVVVMKEVKYHLAASRAARGERGCQEAGIMASWVPLVRVSRIYEKLTICSNRSS